MSLIIIFLVQNTRSDAKYLRETGLVVAGGSYLCRKALWLTRVNTTRGFSIIGKVRLHYYRGCSSSGRALA